MPGRIANSGDYRYGFNGMEKDDELKGSGNSYTTTWRQYDPRLGKWLSVDPMADRGPWISPYAFSFNNPLLFVDDGGDWPKWSKVLDGIQLGLDVVGMIPGVGIAADLINAGVSVARGNYAEAGMNLLSAIPIVGNVSGAAKIGYKARKLFKASQKLKHADEIIGATNKVLKNTVKYTGGILDEVVVAASKLNPQKVIDEYKGVSGVYVITFKDGTKYVGQSKHIGKRFKQHFGKRGKFKGEMDDVTNIQIKRQSGKAEMDVLEQKNIDALQDEGFEIGDKLRNKRNQVGNARKKAYKEDGLWDDVNVNGSGTTGSGS